MLIIPLILILLAILFPGFIRAILGLISVGICYLIFVGLPHILTAQAPVQASVEPAAIARVSDQVSAAPTKNLIEPLDVKFQTTASNGRNPIITSVTNLPEGTKLIVYLLKPHYPDEERRRAANLPVCWIDCFPLQVDQDVIVHNGRFVYGPFNDHGGPLVPGSYIVQAIANPMGQSESVMSILGQHGENLKGEFVYMDESGTQVHPNHPWNPNGSESERMEGFFIEYRTIVNIN